MNSASENRHKNLLRLIEEFGTLEAIAELGGWPHTVYLSQLKKQAPDSKSGKPREIGPATARRLEKACGKPANWMDQDNGKFLTEINNDFVHNNGRLYDGRYYAQNHC